MKQITPDKYFICIFSYTNRPFLLKIKIFWVGKFVNKTSRKRLNLCLNLCKASNNRIAIYRHIHSAILPCNTTFIISHMKHNVTYDIMKHSYSIRKLHRIPYNLYAIIIFKDTYNSTIIAIFFIRNQQSKIKQPNITTIQQYNTPE